MNLEATLTEELVRLIAEGIRVGLKRDDVAACTRARPHVDTATCRLRVGTSDMDADEWALERARNIVMSLPDLHTGLRDGEDTLARLGETMQRDGLHLTIQPGKRFVCQVVMGMPPRHAAVKTGDDITDAIKRGLAAAKVWAEADGRIS